MISTPSHSEPTFLPAQAPPGATSHRIDFPTCDPPIPEYKNLFAALIENVLTEPECNELIRLAESTTLGTGSESSTPTWERALINAGNGKEVLSTDSRNCGRIVWDSHDIAARLLDRLMPFLREYGLNRIDNQPLVTGLAGRNKAYRLTRLNERLRFLKYEGGEYFRPHWDGRYATPDRTERSWYTVHLYLNGDGDQNLDELRREEARVKENTTNQQDNVDVGGKLLGGSTSFIPRYEEQDRQVRVFPRTGSVLVFQQNSLMHGGDPVYRGTKYTLRTEILYRQE
ncbi:hypothetical protein FE257_012292 [Aspergillus nanangensis]|uniref:Prolyl 4-hydroxylase alpha subunit domain-containing protein n=1 Tax=Aspergillus nanangensis TaxID=2582783 RepID=A0AAD4GQT1_ASPNN|nr:hypothetical protein FE257_012292 [Aspergillus nanangensis]